MQSLIWGVTSTGFVLSYLYVIQRPSSYTLFPYTTLFRSLQVRLTRNPSVPSDQKFLFRGMYITDRSEEQTSELQSRIDVVWTHTPQKKNAGGNQTITLPAAANLSGTATDDGLPSGALGTS